MLLLDKYPAKGKLFNFPEPQFSHFSSRLNLTFPRIILRYLFYNSCLISGRYYFSEVLSARVKSLCFLSQLMEGLYKVTGWNNLPTMYYSRKAGKPVRRPFCSQY